MINAITFMWFNFSSHTCKVFFCSKVRTASIHRPAPHHHTLPRPLTHQIESQTLPRQSAETFPRSSAHTQTLPRPISRVDNTQVGRLLNIFMKYIYSVFLCTRVCLCVRVSGCVCIFVTVLWRRGWGQQNIVMTDLKRSIHSLPAEWQKSGVQRAFFFARQKTTIG